MNQPSNTDGAEKEGSIFLGFISGHDLQRNLLDKDRISVLCSPEIYLSETKYS